MFGKGLFGSGLRATPQQEEESRRLAERFGMPYDTLERLEPDSPVQMRGGWENDFTPMQQPAGGRQGFWQGGDKFTARDGIAGLLAAVGDAFAQQSGSQGYGVKGLLGGRLSAQKLAQEAQAAQAQRAAKLQDYEAQKQIDQRYAAPEKPDAFTQTMINAGIDPKSPQGIDLYRQRAMTQAMPAPNLVGSPETGYRWLQPPAPSMGGGGLPTFSEDDWNKAGGAGSNVGGNFRGW